MKHSLLQTFETALGASIFRHPVYPKPKLTLLGASLYVVNNFQL